MNALPLLAGILSSLIPEYVPGLRRWFGGLSPIQRFLLILVISAASSVGAALYVGGWSWSVVLSGVNGWLASQGVHQITQFAKRQRAIRAWADRWGSAMGGEG